MNPLEKTLLQDQNPLVRSGVIAESGVGVNKRTFVDAITESENRRRNPFTDTPAQPVDIEQRSRMDLDKIISESRIAASQIFGQPEATNAPKRKALQARARRLAPAKSPGVLGSTGIGGNPYSVNTQPLLTGLGNLAVSLLNKERAARVEGFGQDLNDLVGAENRNLERQEKIEEFTSKEVPRRIANQEIRERQLDVKAQDLKNSLARINAQGESWAERDRARAEAQRSLEELRQSGRMTQAEYNAEQRRLLQADRLNYIERTASDRASATVTAELMRTIRAPLATIYRSLSDLREIEVMDPENAEVKKQIEDLQAQEKRIIQTQVNTMVEGNKMSIDAANRMLDGFGIAPMPAPQGTQRQPAPRQSTTPAPQSARRENPAFYFEEL